MERLTSLFWFSYSGGSLIEKLDSIAINIGKVGLFIALIVFIVLSLQWAVREFAQGGQCTGMCFVLPLCFS